MEAHQIIHNGLRPEIEALLKAPKEKQRFMWYSNKVDQKTEWDVASYNEWDERLLYSETKIKLRMAGQHLFPAKKSKKGFEFDKQTKKLKMWYMSTPSDFAYITSLLHQIKKEWVINEGFVPWLTKGLLEKILADKITNPSQAVTYIIKYLRLKGIDHQRLKKLIKNDPKSKMMVLSWVNVLSNLNDMFELFENGGKRSLDWMMRDVIRQARILGEKVNLKWSAKRIQETHNDWTEKIMAIELDDLKDETVDYQENFQSLLPPNFELIKNRKRLYVEGSTMKHCVYTNYWSSVKNRQYMVIHVKQEDSEYEVTAGIDIYPMKSPDRIIYYPRLDQINGRYNSVIVTEKTQKQVSEFVDSVAFREMVDKEFSRKIAVLSQQDDLMTEHLPF